MAQPPPPRSISTKVSSGFKALATNEEKMLAIRRNAETSKFFDGSAPGTRKYCHWCTDAGKKRDQARAYYELFVRECHGVTESSEIWDAATFTQRTKQFLEGLTNVITGKFEDKIKTSTLWQYKHALYWWAAILVPDFHLLWQKWHTEVSRHIHQVTMSEALSSRSWKKSNLSDGELVLIFKYISEQRYGVDNLKQHWAAMLLVWLTAARPGSFTVGEGYRKGASLGLPDKVRESSATLRWSDVDFFNMKDGIALRVNFKYHKGYRNPNEEASRSANAQRQFTFLPSSGEKLEFDLPLILFGIAFQRGLFVQTLDEILDQRPSEVYLKKQPDVDRQAVFVGADQAGRLTPTKPMLVQSLNPKLQSLCEGVGLLERNTYYSLRRTAIIETRRNHGTEQAKDLAFHVANSNSLFFYDNVGFGDVDMQQFRTGGEQSMSREDIRKFFSQANLARYNLGQTNESTTLVQAIDEAVSDKLHKHEQYIAKELELRQAYESVGQELAELQESGTIPANENIPRGYAPRDVVRYRSLAVEHQLVECIQKIDEQLKSRKALYRHLRLEFRKEVIADLRKRHIAVVDENVKQASRKFTPGSRCEPTQLKTVKVTGLNRSEGEAALDEIISRADASDDEDIDGVDKEVLEDQNLASQEEPECWEDLPDKVTIQIGSGISSSAMQKARRNFLVRWLQLADSVVAQSNLLCPRCQIDPTIDPTDKKRKFTRYRLNTHLRGSTHSRTEQLRRALRKDGYRTKSNILCPVCKHSRKGITAFLNHLREGHPEQLWDALEDEAQNSDGSSSQFRGFSDAVDEDAQEVIDERAQNAMEETDFEGFSPPRAAYKGKGKANVMAVLKRQ